VRKGWEGGVDRVRWRGLGGTGFALGHDRGRLREGWALGGAKVGGGRNGVNNQRNGGGTCRFEGCSRVLADWKGGIKNRSNIIRKGLCPGSKNKDSHLFNETSGPGASEDSKNVCGMIRKNQSKKKKKTESRFFLREPTAQAGGPEREKPPKHPEKGTASKATKDALRQTEGTLI